MKIAVSRLRMAVLLAALAGGLWTTLHSIGRAWDMGDWSDASRQWEVCQYVKARINPYDLAFHLLRDTYGPATGPDRILLREHRIYSISSSNWKDHPSILPGHPPPEATYPPSTLSMLVPTIGFLPKFFLLPVYTTANILFLSLLLVLLAKWLARKPAGIHGFPWGWSPPCACSGPLSSRSFKMARPAFSPFSARGRPWRGWTAPPERPEFFSRFH